MLNDGASVLFCWGYLPHHVWLNCLNHCFSSSCGHFFCFLIPPGMEMEGLRSSHPTGGRWGRGCQSSLSYLCTQTHTHTRSRHAVRKCLVQSSSAHCKPVVVISVLGLWMMVIELHISAPLSGRRLGDFIPQAETQTRRGKTTRLTQIAPWSSNRLTIVSPVICADNSYTVVFIKILDSD